MYEIYINDHPIILTSITDGHYVPNEHDLVVFYTGQKKSLLNYIDKLEKSTVPTKVVISHADLKTLKRDFWSLFKVVKAAGGVIVNENDEILMILRLDRWDLPKGKKDKGEKNYQTALREVEEEVGLKCRIDTKLGKSYHTYRLRGGRRVLKVTYWYRMHPLSEDVKLQTEEHITNYRWIKPMEVSHVSPPIYASLRSIVEDLV